jgi:N-dimethylarginine dimethylaminohydrolase
VSVPDGSTAFQSESGRLRRVLLTHPRDAFGGPEAISAQWKAFGYRSAPDFGAACKESDRLAALLEGFGAQVVWSEGPGEGLDSLYVRDASILCDRGVVLCRMGKEARRGEPGALCRTYERLGVPILGTIEAPGTLEGGDVTWLGSGSVAVGRGYRTNAEGIRQLTALLGDSVDEVVIVPLPHWRGPSDVFHLMSVISPVADRLAVVYSPLLPVPFRELLVDRGFDLVEVPDGEFATMGSNVLAVAPRVVVALEGNPVTRRRMERAGVEVHGYRGAEISVKGLGGPTCLTRPLEREVP